MSRPTSRVSRVVVTGPLAEFAETYAAELGVRGYTRRSAVGQLRQVARLSCWLEARSLTAADLSLWRVEEFVAFQRSRGSSCSQWSRPGLWCLLDVLGAAGVPTGEEPIVSLSPMETLLGSFEHHLRSERGLAAGTVRGYVGHVRWFLDGLGSDQDLAGLAAAEVTAAVLRRSEGVSVSATQYFVAALRSFLRFCFLEGLVERDLSQATLSMTGRRRCSLPKGITKTDADALLGSCDRRTSIGRRDYAMMLVLLRLGLRRSEVASLTLDDLDWRAGQVLVHGKGARQDRLPLPAEVGEAIAGYLKRGRPRSDARQLFLQARAPFTPIASGTVSSTVRRACRRAGVAELGAHRLRHTAACEMVAAGVPLVEIGQVLRHHSLQSTALYARVDVEQLRLLAVPWPGGES